MLLHRRNLPKLDNGSPVYSDEYMNKAEYNSIIVPAHSGEQN